MNIELEEVVQDVSDDALKLAAGGAQGGYDMHGEWDGFAVPPWRYPVPGF